MAINTRSDSFAPNCHILDPMATKFAGDGRIGPEGRIVVPAEVRRHLGLAAGDKVRFVMYDDGRVELITPRMMIEALWANNQTSSDVDSGQVIRDMRVADLAMAASSESDQEDLTDEADEPERRAKLLEMLGLSR
jgi:AbrB family looped-hinge helix DNA binding protein